MIMTFVIVAAVLVGATGLILGMFLGVASEKFKVEVDERESQVRAALPGNNCGACGFPGCDGCAKAIAQGEAPANQCPVGGADVAAKIAAIMGSDAGDTSSEKMVAFVHCQGSCEKAKQTYSYSGIADCDNIFVVPNGTEKECPYSCCGYGSCVKACHFDAIHVVNGVAVVDKEKCVACGACQKACPKGIISLVPYKKKHIVACKNQLKGKQVKDACQVGCIACGMCERNCPFDAIHVENDLAVMNEKCKDCGICAQKCPTGAITGKRPPKPAAAAGAEGGKASTAAPAAKPAASEKPAGKVSETAKPSGTSKTDAANQKPVEGKAPAVEKKAETSGAAGPEAQGAKAAGEAGQAANAEKPAETQSQPDKPSDKKDEAAVTAAGEDKKSPAETSGTEKQAGGKPGRSGKSGKYGKNRKSRR